MKSISEWRTVLKFQPMEGNIVLSVMNEQKIDYNVFLESYKVFLQRDYVWNIEQKRELIYSVLMRRFIPRLSFLCNKDGVYQVIDGKQRLNAFLGFYNNEFDIIVDDISYHFKDLPDDYQRVIGGFMIPYNIVHDDYDNDSSDDDKIKWFNFINYAGTPMESEHMAMLNRHLNDKK